MKNLIGPRPSLAEFQQNRLRYQLPTIFLSLAALILLISIFTPYWKMELQAPQYPKGLHVQAYINRLEGDVDEINGLNHYIGMRPLEEAAQLERAMSFYAIMGLSLLVLSAIYVHNRWAAFLTLPALLFPFVFLGDLYYWMRNFGQNLDPHAPLSSAIKPFVPPVWGTGMVGQFRTVASGDIGFYLAAFAGVLILIGLYYHRRAYKPLVDEMG